ncbi:MAG: aliphatic sulfonate ABC transporter substrate-binding protein [Nitrospira sp.]|jgi:NitT/TauT family transport system substrate-binding protein|nr:aliphatic sulfonate ABC transporter substrate-binding protein [Nitrospira sp.]
MKRLSAIALGLLLLTASAGISTPQQALAAETIRVGHFPNITHVQGLVAQHLSRTGRGWFEERLGQDVKIEWFIYNAGPSAMEAILSGSIDLTYVGPSPALNAYAKSNGEEIRIIAGAATGGAALVVQPDSTFTQPADFRGKTIATPQLGNTQDVACRAWLANGGLKITQTGGDAFIVPTPNPDQFALFQSKKLDAVWTVEPWVSRLERDAGGKILLEQSKDSITVLVSSVKFLKTKRELAKKFAQAHRELTEWILAHPAEAKQMAQQELAAETHAAVSTELIAQAWTRIGLTTEASPGEYQQFVANAQRAGFIRTAPDLSRLIERLN